MCLKYVFTQTLCHEQDVTQGQFLSGVKLVWISFSLLFHWLRTQSALLFKNSWGKERWIHTFSQLAFSRIWTLVADFFSYYVYYAKFASIFVVDQQIILILSFFFAKIMKLTHLKDVYLFFLAVNKLIAD